jgi:AcrR family transcriptional regulator
MVAKSDTAKVQRNGRGVNTRRYESTLRQAQAQQTRQAVLDAGRALLIERGYARTTVRAIAERAGVAVETVYLHFRSKPRLLQALLDIATGGDEEPIPVYEREWAQEVLRSPGARAKLATFAEKITVVNAQLAPLHLATRSAAAADETAAQIWAERKATRLRGMGMLTDHLLEVTGLRPGVETDDARDRLFTLTSPEVYGLLVLELGWSPARYASWLADVLIQQLLPT